MANAEGFLALHHSAELFLRLARHRSPARHVGSYGSGPIMSVEQRKTVISVVTERVEGRIPIVVHAGDPDTLTTIDLAKFAAQKNVSAIASLTPYYYSAWPRGGRHPLPAPNRCGG